MKRFKKGILFVHRWLGLISGLVVFIVSITGCIYVFQQEISDVLHRKQLSVAPQQTRALPLSVLQAKAQAALGEKKPITFIQTYRDPAKAWTFGAFKGDKEALTYFGAVVYYDVACVNPYTGEVTGVIDHKYDFFNIVKFLHWSLLLNTPYGQPIVGWSTFIFVLLMITGLVLWWPKRKKKDLKQAFTVKWKARWRRLNYDLHNVLGFYVTLLALIIGFTGMVWAFKWFQATVYVVASGTTTPPPKENFKSVQPAATITGNGMDIAFADAWHYMPQAERVGVRPPADPTGTIRISTYESKKTFYDRDELQYDQYSGQRLALRARKEKNRGERLIEMNYDIHVGAIAGLPGKIMAFLASLICASLPVTGFLVWWGKRNKKSKKTSQAKVPAARIEKEKRVAEVEMV